MTGFGESLLRTVMALFGVTALAAGSLWLLRRRGPRRLSSLRVVARLPLEARRTVYLIEAAGRFLLVGVGDGPMTTLLELDAAAAQKIEEQGGADGGQGLRETVRRVVGA